MNALIDPARHFASLDTTALSLDDPVQRFLYTGTWVNVLAWSVASLVAAFRPGARTPVLVAGAGRPAILAPGVVDSVLAGLVVLALRSGVRRSAAAA